MKALGRAIALLLAALLSVPNVALLRSASLTLRTDDRNHDGRPDVWRWYDAAGHLVRVDIDTNFDGHADWREEYQDNHRTRLEVDRNYDGRVDRVVEFDPQTDSVLREELDTNFNGHADLLRLYANGRPVFVERASNDSAAPDPSAAGPLSPFSDPFLNDLAVQARAHTPHAIVAVLGLSFVLRLPGRLTARRENGAILARRVAHAALARRRTTSLRGPPLLQSL